MTGRVLGPVGLRLDYDTRRRAFGRIVDENATEQVYGRFARVPVVEIGFQNIFGDAWSPVSSVIRRDSSSRSRPASERMEDFSSGLT